MCILNIPIRSGPCSWSLWKVQSMGKKSMFKSYYRVWAAFCRRFYYGSEVLDLPLCIVMIWAGHIVLHSTMVWGLNWKNIFVHFFHQLLIWLIIFSTSHLYRDFQCLILLHNAYYFEGCGYKNYDAFSCNSFVYFLFSDYLLVYQRNLDVPKA